MKWLAIELSLGHSLALVPNYFVIQMSIDQEHTSRRHITILPGASLLHLKQKLEKSESREDTRETTSRTLTLLNALNGSFQPMNSHRRRLQHRPEQQTTIK